jgi:hypothetical protein
LARGAMGYSENATIYGNDTTAEPGFKEAALRNFPTTLTVAVPKSCGRVPERAASNW